MCRVVVHGHLELLDVFRRELRPVDGQGQLVELAGELERHLIVLVVHRRAGIGAHVEVLVPLQRHRNGLFHLLRRDHLAVDLEYAGAAAAQAAGAAEGERGGTQTVVLEVEFERVLAGCERLRTFPLDALEIDQVPGEHRLALEQIEAVAGEAAALGHDHAFGAALRDLDLGLEVVGRSR